jgi:hypothetical protein
MKDDSFNELLESVKKADAIIRVRPSRAGCLNIRIRRCVPFVSVQDYLRTNSQR